MRTHSAKFLDGSSHYVLFVYGSYVVGSDGQRSYVDHRCFGSALGCQLLGQSLSSSIFERIADIYLATQVPFALVMESIRDMELASSSVQEVTPPGSPPPQFAKQRNHISQPFRANLRTASSSRSRTASALSDCEPLLSDRNSPRLESAPSVSPKRAESGGTILGIHNLSIVAPQFFVAIVAALIFKVIEASKGGLGENTPGDGSEEGLRGSNDVVWVLRFGGIAALGGAVMSRWVLKTRSERSYVRLLKDGAVSLERDSEIEE